MSFDSKSGLPFEIFTVDYVIWALEKVIHNPVPIPRLQEQLGLPSGPCLGRFVPDLLEK